MRPRICELHVDVEEKVEKSLANDLPILPAGLALELQPTSSKTTAQACDDPKFPAGPTDTDLVTVPSSTGMRRREQMYLAASFLSLFVLGWNE